MKHIFTFLAVLALLLCLFFIVVTVATFNSSWEVQLGKGENALRARSVGARYGELIYTDRVTADSERMDLTKTTKEYPGLVIHKEARRHQKEGEPESASYTYAVSPVGPIILFAILPLAWVVARLGRRARKRAGGSQESKEPAK